MARRPRSSWELYVEPVIGIVAIAVTISTCAAVAGISAARPNDFTVFLESARWLRQGLDVYQQPLRSGPGYNLNPPAVVLLFVPFSFLPDRLALYVWTALAVGAYLLASFWIARAVAPRRFVTIAGVLLLSQPAITSLLLGQMGALLMVLMTASWLADRENRPAHAGVLLGIAIAAKPFLLVFAVYLVWRRSRALVAGMAAGIAAMTIVGLLAAGASGFRSWIATFSQISWTAHVANASLLGMLTRALSVTPEILNATPIVDRPGLVQPLWWASVAIVGAVTVAALARTRDRDKAWAILLIASLLVSPLGWVYYATIAAGPLMAAARAAPRHALIVIAAGFALLNVPPGAAPLPGPVGILLFGSIYAWGLLLMFAGVALASVSRSVLPDPGSASNVASPA